VTSHEDWSAEQRAAIEAGLRSMSWKQLVAQLKSCVEEHHRPTELPPTIRRWLELNRSGTGTEEDALRLRCEIEALQAAWDEGVDRDWLGRRTERIPISGWIVTLCHFLKDGVRWWLLTGQRHDDKASLVGSTAPSPATKLDLKKLGKIVMLAGGDPKRELLRTGAITREEHDELIAAGSPEIAEYGQIFYWWRAR
jgi:hypothetical protein